MATMTVHRPTTPRDAVLEALSEREYAPAELLVHIAQLTTMTDEDVKDAISELLDEMKIELSADRKLRLRRSQRIAS
jgi:hypothetical protein